MRESLIEKLAEISIRVFIWGKTKGIQDLEEISADLNSLASDIAEKEWHTGAPTEDGWYLVAYQHKNKMTYRAVRFFLEEGLDMEFLESEGGIYCPDIWKAVAWQKIEPYKEDEDGHTD